MSIAAASLSGIEAFADPFLDSDSGVVLRDGTVRRGGLRRRHRVVVGPGKVRVASTVAGQEQDNPLAAVRGIVSEWSRDSRLNMVEAMCSIDWRPVVDPQRPGWRPAMVTLTLPRDWLAVAPTAADFKKLVERFWSRWTRKWGKPACLWKLEFQNRRPGVRVGELDDGRAPHLHIYTAVPPGREFQEWLSMTWTASVFGIKRFGPRRSERSWDEFVRRVYHLDGKAIGDHLRAGTGIDWRDGIQASDPKRLAVYFLKRAAGHNLGISKEYQHRVPQAWADSGGAGRFWGYKGLDRCEVEVQVDEDDFIALRRVLRRWAKANGRPVRALSGGPTQGGMVLANDAPTLIAQAARWVEGKNFSENGEGRPQRDRPPGGDRRPRSTPAARLL